MILSHLKSCILAGFFVSTIFCTHRSAQSFYSKYYGILRTYASSTRPLLRLEGPEDEASTWVVEWRKIYCSVQQIRTPFATIALVQSAGGLYVGCDIFSCDYTLPVPHPHSLFEWSMTSLLVGVLSMVGPSPKHEESPSIECEAERGSQC